MKTCKYCFVDKPVTDFYHHSARCKSCHFIRDKEYRLSHKREGALRQKRYRERHPEWVAKGLAKQKTNREWLMSLKDKPCSDCHLKFPTCCMDWDHVRGEKVMNIGEMRKRNTRISLTLTEIAKCDLVCSNCHRIRTYQRSTSK